MTYPIKFRTIYLKKNLGHGEARRRSLAESRNALVALMDADDISIENRFEKELQVFIEKPFLSVVGGQIAEFVDTPSNVTGIREVPCSHIDIANYIKKRCPMNQVSVMLKKEDVEASGGYLDWYCEEDYYLWLRMVRQGYKFENIPEVVVNVRVGEAMAERRGGWKYFKSETRLQKYMLDTRVISLPQFLYNVALRFGGELIISNGIRRRYIEAADTEPKHRNIMRYLCWFYNNSSQKEWDDAAQKYYINWQPILSAKHLISRARLNRMK